MKIPKWTSDNGAYERWVTFAWRAFLLYVCKGPRQPYIPFVSLLAGGRQRKVQCQKNKYLYLCLKWKIIHLAEVQLAKRARAASTCTAFLLFFFARGKCDKIEPDFCVMALSFSATHFDFMAATHSLAHGSRLLLEASTSVWNGALSNRLVLALPLDWVLIALGH